MGRTSDFPTFGAWAMDWTWFLFSFKGRINRAKYWLAGLIILCWMLFVLTLLAGIGSVRVVLRGHIDQAAA
jgi:uncharacterized membrane protein YhaH (DUF805 family)